MVVNFKLSHKLVSSIILCFISISSFAQITINDSVSAEDLVQSLINGPCAEISNVTSFTGVDENPSLPSGIGSFNSSFSGFPFKEGVVLTSGDVNEVRGPNEFTASGGGWSGDSDLEAIIPLDSPSNDASWIEFDFTPLTSQFGFNFIMASEEYNLEFECEFSDAFAFILTNRNTGEVENLAVIPGTDIPIKVTNIRPDVDFDSTCDAMNEQFFNGYNFTQPNGDTQNPDLFLGSQSPTNMNGRTVPLTANAEVIPGNPYTIKLVVADDVDTEFNIAVFLEAGSFNIGGTPLGEDLLVENGTALCIGSDGALDATIDIATTYSWTMDGVTIPGETNPTLDITQPGTYGVEVTLIEGCEIIDEIIVEFFNGGDVDLGPDFVSCFDGGTDTLTAATTGTEAGITFAWSLDGDIIPGETSETLEITNIGTYTVEIIGAGCLLNDSVTVNPRNISVTLLEDFDICPGESQTLVATTDDTDIDYQWLLNSIQIPGATNPTLDIDASGQGEQTYSIQISTGMCIANAEVIVNSVENCIITQGISPDGSPGLNDFLDLTFLASRSGIENLQIYNRHGLVVFEQDQYINEWRGQSDGNSELLPTGTYFYVITFTNEDPEYGAQASGWIYLNRNEE